MGSNKNKQNIIVIGEIRDFRKWTIYSVNPALLKYIHAIAHLKSLVTGHFLSEYDLQYEIWKYLQHLYKNTNGVVKRETQKKVDIVIETKNNDKPKPKVYYELTTYFKPNEKKLDKIKIAKDFRKLAFILNSQIESGTLSDGVSAYSIIVARRNVLNNIGKMRKKEILHQKIHQLFNDLSFYSPAQIVKDSEYLKKQYTCDFIINPTHDVDKKIDRKIIIRPSIKKMDKNYAVLFFEIKLKQG